MEQLVLNDKEIFPTEDVIFSYIGKTRSLWILLFEFIHGNYPDFEEKWKYYNDGKSWLLKVTRKANTVFWLSVIMNSFKITFYFTDRANDAINSSSLSDELKDQFKSGKYYNKIRGITVVFKNNKDIEDVKTLIGIKLSIK